ncbi:MAG: hypothetical protein K6T75_09980 [Acetobacteraceae bacterium]|nr:hypothetical protein [Acetobacteraceae bacterium]
MKDLLCDQFQDIVNECLVRHRSVLDVLTKLQEADARIGRAVSKAVTGCGCISIGASRQRVPPGISLKELKEHMASHVEGKLCEHCQEAIEAEIGNLLFYLAAVCNLFDLNLYDVLLKEQKKLAALGVFNFS